MLRVGSPESRSLGIPNASLLSVSSTGELAILLKKEFLFGTEGTGTLARVPLGGGAPRQIVDDVFVADWSPDGSQLMVVRRLKDGAGIEYPVGKTIYRPPGALSMARVSPDGEKIAVIDYGSGVPHVSLVDRSGKRTDLSHDWIYVDSSSIAWNPSGKEVWAVGAVRGQGLGVWAVDLSGHQRLVSPLTDLEVLHDISKDGRVLVEREINTREILFGGAEGEPERNLSWLEESSVACLSDDGKALLFDETGEGGGVNESVYLRPTDGGPAVRLGDGEAVDLSPDGKWALTRSVSKDGIRLVVLPTATGEPRPIPLDGYRVVGGSFAPPDGKRIVVAAKEPGKGLRAYVVDLAGGKPRAFTPEGLTGGAAFSPDGKSVAFTDAEHRAVIYPVDGSEPRPLAGLEPFDVPIQWGSDGDTLYLTREGEVPKPVYRYSLSTGKKTLWKRLIPADRSGLVRIERVYVTPDGSHYAYSFNRVTSSDLFVVTGWK
jgi:Tol biopolymer transport system component